VAPLSPLRKMVTYPLLAKVPMLRRELDDSASRMWVFRVGVCNCIIGRSTDADVSATWPNAMATVLSPMMGRFLLGLLKWEVVPELSRVVLTSCEAWWHSSHRSCF
jgi:hypothetical protein